MLRFTRLGNARLQHNAIVGAEMPTFSRFPYKANTILHLYRSFWRLILRYPENERHDLIFRLRNEFRSKRHAGHPKLIGKAVSRGESLLEMYKSRIEFSESKPERRIVYKMGNEALRKERELFEQTVVAEVIKEAAADESGSSTSNSRTQLSKKQRIRNNILCADANDSGTDIRGLQKRVPLTATPPIAMGGTNSVNTLWEQVQQSTMSTLPNLRHYRHSRTVQNVGDGVDSARTFMHTLKK